MRVHTSGAFSFIAALLLFIVAVVCAGRIATAQPAAPAAATGHQAPHANQLLNVKTFDPKLNLMQSGGYVAGPAYYGYAPGWGYRGGYWGDPYGARYYQEPVTTTHPQLGIDYINVSHMTMTEIDFGLVVNGVLRAEVKDAGTFSPGVEIKHKFGISTNVFPIQSALPHCVPLRVTFENGTKWFNPALPAKNPNIYVPSSEIHTNP